MHVLGLLQNQWARDPAAVLAMLARWPQRRHELIRVMLARSLSGERLRAAFGDWFAKIVWENASPCVAGESDGSFAPDTAHVNAAIVSIEPQVVIAFGVQAARAIYSSDWWGRTILSPHPAARSGDIGRQLRMACEALDRLVAKFAEVAGSNPAPRVVFLERNCYENVDESCVLCGGDVLCRAGRGHLCARGGAGSAESRRRQG